MVSFTPIPGRVLVLPDDVVKDLSRDQMLAYRYAHAIQSGRCYISKKIKLIYRLLQVSCLITCLVRP